MRSATVQCRADVPHDLLLASVLGVPLVLWSVNNLRRVLPAERMSLFTTDPRIRLAVQRHGVVVSESTGVPSGSLGIDPCLPFCSAHTLLRALERGDGDLAAFQSSPIERIQVHDDASLELARAIARGLAPDHACIAGIQRMRLPLSADLRAIISDVDGCLTDGGIAYAGGAEALRTFNTHDGLGHHLLAEAKIAVGWLSATSNGASIERRATQLNVPAIDIGVGPKDARFLDLCRRLGVAPRQCLYIGDDRNDLPVFPLAGATACPLDAHAAVRAAADLVLETPGGRGCFREAADILLAGLARR